VFIFGGHHSPQARLNDTWFLDVKSMEWRKIGGEKDNTTNIESSIGAPGPRANVGATVYKNKVYMFGGHGGLNYARVAFNDLYSFDLTNETWEKHVSNNNAPDGRGGHSLFASDDKIYIYGGWNAEMQFNNVWVFNLETKEWTDPDIYNEIPRWNHCSALVEAIPTWKFFIFGGECAEYQEGTARSFGAYVNTSCILDLGTLRWNTFASDPELFDNIPCPREYSAMTYDERDRRLIIYGGWNNGWYSDLYTLNVAKIVGPSYAITASDPALGQLSGNVSLRVTGRGFKDVNIRVLFTQGNKPVDTPSKLTLEVPGTFVSETELTCVTPSFEAIGGANGAKECVMQLSIGSGDLTTTWIPFQYFLNTRAKTSLAYGAGLLKGLCVGEPTAFQIVARNDNNENRTSGRDVFAVKIKKHIPVPEDNEDPDAKPTVLEIPCDVIDNDNGSYDCKYKVAVDGEVEIHIHFQDDKDQMVPIRGSPYVASFAAGAKPADNLMTGPIMVTNFKDEVNALTELMVTKEKAIALKDKDLKNVKVLLGVKTEVESTFSQADAVALQID
jgi:dynein heavy chain, axonemal